MPFCIADSPTAPAKQTLILSGADGPLASYILKLGADTEDGWNLEGKILLETLAPGQTGEIYWITTEGRSRVVRICGRSTRDATELLVHLHPVNESALSCSTETVESLRLGGGYGTPKSSWAWSAPKMAIGAVRLVSNQP